MSIKDRPAYELNQWLWRFLDILYPPSCGGCGAKGTRWCRACQQNTERIVPPLCPRCGQSQPIERLCTRCRRQPPQFSALRSWAVFKGPLRNAIHRLKYKRDISLGEVLSRHLSACLVKTDWRLDMIVPVPLGVARMAERGYNQASLLAKPLAGRAGLPYRVDILKKTRDTPSQVGLDFERRRANVAGTFEVVSTDVRDKTVLVVDDVATSGATLNACTQALLSAGARAVYAITLARTASQDW